MESNKKQNGFTLIELSIVLVIIGLIVAGVVGGQSLIRSAKIKHAISEINNIRIAINTFKDYYDALPGDMSNATMYWPGVTSDGDGNFHFQSSDNLLNNEGGYLWHHMGLAEIYRPFTRPNVGGFVAEYGVNSPEIFPDTGAIGEYRFGVSAHNRYSTPYNYVQIGGFASSDNDTNTAFLDPVTGSFLDNKMDDGHASLGKLIGYSESGGTCTDYSGGGNDYQQPAGSVNYDLSNSSADCRFAFILGF